MKKIVILCLATLLLGVGCFEGVYSISGASKSIIETVSDNTVSAIDIDRLCFTRSDVFIRIIPIDPSEVARVEVTYSEEFDNYGFYVTIENSVISVGTGFKDYIYDIDEFNMTIYANFNEIGLSGGGYDALVDATGIKVISIGTSGAVDCDVSSLVASELDVEVSGSFSGKQISPTISG